MVTKKYKVERFKKRFKKFRLKRGIKVTSGKDYRLFIKIDYQKRHSYSFFTGNRCKSDSKCARGPKDMR